MEAKEELEIIDAREVWTLDRHEHLVIAGLYLAWPARVMADTFGCSEATIHRTVQEAVADVFEESGLVGTSQLLRLWGERHSGDCTLPGWKMIENNQLSGSW